MYNVSDAVIEAYQTDGVHKELRVVINNVSYGNDKIVDGSFNLKQSILESEAFEAIGCIAASMSVELHAQFPTKIRGTKVQVYISAGNTQELLIFTGTVDKCTKTANGWKRSIEAYDIIYNLSGQSGHSDEPQLSYNVTDWFNNHANCTTLALLNDVCSMYGINVRQGNLPLVNGSVITTCGKVKAASDLSVLDVMKAVMQINGCFGYITGDGYFSWMYLTTENRDEVGTLYPSSFSFPSNTLYPGTENHSGEDPSDYATNYIGAYEKLEYQDFNMLPIDKVIVRNSDKDDKAGSWGEGTNKYIIEGNILVKDSSIEVRNGIAQKIYEILNSVYYVPFSADLYGLPYLQCGDEVNFMDFVGDFGQASLNRYYIMSRTLSGGQHLKDAYSANGDEYMHEFKTGQADTSGGEDVDQAIEDLREEIADEYPTNEEVEEMLDNLSNMFAIQSVNINDLPFEPDPHTLYLIQGECRLVDSLGPNEGTDPEDLEPDTDV